MQDKYEDSSILPRIYPGCQSFSWAVSGFSQGFIVSRGFAIRNFGPRPAKSIRRASEINLCSKFTNCSKLTIVILHSVIQASSVLKWSIHVLVKESAIECLITRHLKSNTTTPRWQRWVEPNSMLMLITPLSRGHLLIKPNRKRFSKQKNCTASFTETQIQLNLIEFFFGSFKVM